jgi:zinc/manganese transport system ATP-binding protein
VSARQAAEPPSAAREPSAPPAVSAASGAAALPGPRRPEPLPPGDADRCVTLRGAAVRVGGRSLWAGAELDVARGEFAAVLGPNGAGKSTLVKVLLGLHGLAAGQVRVLGLPPVKARPRVGYVPQRRGFDTSLRLRGRDLVGLGLNGHRFGVSLPLPGRAGERRRAERRRVAEVIDLVGAGAYADRPVGACSGGEQQRLLIAQALVRRPELLVLDEPLDSLDLTHQGAVAALVGRICREQGVGVVMVAHDVNPILPWLDRVAYLAAGGVATGPPGEVIRTGTLTRLYGAPVEVLRARDGRLVVVGGDSAAGGDGGHAHGDGAPGRGLTP